ncbi:MAG: hypothetical protein JRI86_03230 [Deltaproteobacteria bacterium]|nr:hypothetical protein [Deltaproteobacteria bacterium]
MNSQVLKDCWNPIYRNWLADISAVIQTGFILTLAGQDATYRWHRIQALAISVRETSQ